MSNQQKNIMSGFIIFLFDALAFYASLYLAYYTRIGILSIFEESLRVYYPAFPLHFPIDHLLHFIWMPLTILFLFIYEKLYVSRLPFWEETRVIIRALFLSILATFAILYIGKLTSRSFAVAIMFLFLYGVVVFPLLRLLSKKILIRMNLWQEKILIFGAGKMGLSTASGIIEEKHMGYDIVGFLDDDKNKINAEITIKGNQYKVLGELNQYGKFVEQYGINTVIFAIPSMKKKEQIAFTQEIQKNIKKVFVVPDINGVALLNTQLYYFFMQELFLLKIVNNLKNPVNRLVKRLFDMMVSIIAIPFLLPIIGIIGLLIKLESRGPVFFGHTRIGYGGKPVKVLKFRSMYSDAQERLKKILETDPEAKNEWETYYKLKNDPRITKVGEFLRRSSLDELPQIFNVLKGNMSLVGPRPVIQDEIDKYYTGYEDYYFMAKPGISGLWQVSGRNDIDYDDRVKLDSWYVLNWSLWLDIIILFKTFAVVIKKEGAY